MTVAKHYLHVPAIRMSEKSESPFFMYHNYRRRNGAPPTEETKNEN